MNKNNTIKLIVGIVLALIFIIPYICCIKLYYDNKALRNATVDSEEVDIVDVIGDNEKPAAGKGRPSFVLVDKGSYTLSVIDDNGAVIATYGIACGKNYGNKEREGDMKTPEGIFHVQSIENAAKWKHDFKDGKGEIEGAYGPWFIRLNTPGHSGIGIHGTHNPASIGTRATEGCMRLQNENVEKLQQLVRPGMVVVIVPSPEDERATGHSANPPITKPDDKRAPAPDKKTDSDKKAASDKKTTTDKKADDNADKKSSATDKAPVKTEPVNSHSERSPKPQSNPTK